MRKLITATAFVLVLGILPAAGHGTTFASGGGNSDAAHACQQGGYTHIVGGTPPSQTVSFRNTGGCVSYAARGGTVYRVSTSTFFVNATVPTWQNTSVNLGPGAIATVTGTGTAYWGYCTVTGNVSTCPSWTAVGPNGLGGSLSFVLAPGLSTYGLVGRVGPGAPFLVGSGPRTVAGPGVLYLGFNDSVSTNCGQHLPGDCFKDNAGGFTATITTYTPIS